jgi:hypothetical protein
LNSARAKELATFKPPDMSLKQFRTSFGGSGVSDDEALLRYFAGVEAVAAMRSCGSRSGSVGAATPLLTLIEQIARRKDSSQVYIKRAGFSLRFERRGRLPDTAS